MSPEIYRQVEVYPVDIPEVNHFKNNRNTQYSIKFQDKVNNWIKTNY